VPVSRGKRRRARKTKPTKDESASTSSASSGGLPRPPIELHLTIGLNVTTKALEAQISASALAPLRVVFVAGAQSAPQHAHLPVLAALAVPKVLLVPLRSAAAEKALCAALGLPRVGVVGLRGDAPGAEPLYACLDDVPAVRVPFLDVSAAGLWLGSRVVGSKPSNQVGPDPI
jgi:RNase P subunit Pop3